MIKVLVTGVAGFIGSNLSDRLISEGNYQIIGIDNLSYGVKEQVPDGVDFHVLDIRDDAIYSLFSGVDFVFHFAAKNCINDCQLDPLETVDINIRGTVNVFEAAKRANVKKVIYAESSAMYEGSKIMPTPETEVSPESFYAISKNSTMHFADAYYRYSNLKSTALRYFCVYGPRQDYRRTIPPVFSAFIIKLLKGEQPIIYGTGEKRRDFIHVDDINDFHIQIMNNPQTDGEVYNLGSGENYSVNEIYTTIASLLNSNVNPKYLSDLPGEAFANLADISKAQSIGWSPKIGLKEGLLSSIDFIKNELKLNRV